MKNLFFTILFLILALGLFPQNGHTGNTSIYYLIRHAEKVSTKNPDPELSETGYARARKWAEVFKNIKFDAIYSSDFIRTRSTAEPTAKLQNLDITIYDPNRVNIEQFLTDTKGKTVLVVGHSNTIPSFVNQLIGKKKYENIEDDNNCNLYIVEITADKATDQLLYIK